MTESSSERGALRIGRGVVSRLQGATIDISALRTSAPFRRMFAAQLISQVGSQVTVLAIFLQVHQITGSPLMVGLVGLVQIVPTVVFALLGGAIADAIDRRKLLLAVQVGMASVSVALAVLALGTPPLWAIYALAALAAALASIDGPARTAVIPALVDDETLRSAVQLREVLTQSGRVFGPVIGGALVAAFGLEWAYALDALTFGFAFVLFLGLPSLVPQTRRRFELSSITEGVHYVTRHPVLASTFVADLVAMVVGMPRAVFPAMAATVWGVGEFGTGLLMAAVPAGALVGVFFLGLTNRVRHEGRAVLVAISVWGAAIALFAVTPWFIPALVLLAIAGAADMVSAVFRQTILLASVPDELRGRMSSVHILIVTGGPPAGDFRAGATAEVIGLRPSVLLGGVGCIVGMVALAKKVPQFAHWVDPKRDQVEASAAAEAAATATAERDARASGDAPAPGDAPASGDAAAPGDALAGPGMPDDAASDPTTSTR